MNTQRRKELKARAISADDSRIFFLFGTRRFLFSLLILMVAVVMTAGRAYAAAPAHQASSAIAASTGADVTVTLPAHQTNDILLLQVMVRDVNDTITWPTGWTQIATIDRGTTARYWWAWKRAASGAETNPLVNKNTTTGDTYAVVTTYRGATTTGDPWEVKGTPTTSTAAAQAMASITTLTAESLVVASLTAENDNPASVAYTATNPATLTSELYVESTTGADVAFAVGAAARAAAGATGAITGTWSTDPNGSAGIVLVLKPLPGVVSINTASTNPTVPNTAVSWTVTFNMSVTGVDATDFSLAMAGGAAGATITSVTGSGTTWTVNANTGTGTAGTLGLNLVDNDSIVSSGVALGGAGATNGNFTGQTYAFAPTVLSINRTSTNPTRAGTSVSWTVTFSASVTGVNAADFTLVQSGGTTGASISSVTGSGTTWTVTATTGTGIVGSLGLNLVDNDSIIDGSSRPLGGTGANNGDFTGEVYTLVLSVVSMNRASTDPAETGASVSWTVVFSGSVTGVNAADFTVVMSGGTAGASVTSVSGSGTTWTVTADTGTAAGTLGLALVDDDSIVNGANPLGGAGAGNGDFTGQTYTINMAFCSPPSNVPAGVTVSCVCDRFGRASLNPSTIYGANWIVSKSDATAVVPYINGTSGMLRLTENTGNNAKAATVPGIFPAAGNYISVEFQHYAYGGSGADGIAVTLSDYSVTAVPGAFGGSLGYAPKDAAACGVAGGCPGFAGGWIGIAIDEFGNYQNPTEGRTGGPGSRPDSVGARGSGSGLTGYPWLAGTNTLTPAIDNTGSTTPAPGYYYQVIVDARNASNVTPETFVTVRRDTSGTGSSYATLIPAFDVFAANPSQNAVPDNWQISFTGSTGGSTNIHEIGGLRVCAQTVAPPSGGTASGFAIIDEAYGTPPSGPAVQSFLTGHIYTKLEGVAFQLNVAALNNSQIVTTYAASGSKSVALKLVDNTDGACVLDSTQANYCSAACVAKTAVPGGSQTMTFVSGDAGKKRSANFTLNTAYKNLVAIASEGTTNACSTDAFAVRPTGITSVTTSNATNTGTTGTPIFKAGTDAFALTATTAGIAANASGYTGVLKIASAASGGLQAVSPATTAGAILPATFSAATSATGSSTSTGNTFTYSEAGLFRLRGYNPASDTTSARGVYDGVWSTTECASLTVAQCDTLRAATWVGVDSITSKGDCVQNSYSNTKDANGKYGCLFGLTTDTNTMGRFTPAYFNVAAASACGTSPNDFTYSGQPFGSVTVTPYNAANAVINNYRSGSFAKDVTISNAGVATGFTNNTILSTAFTGTSGSSSTVTYTFPTTTPTKETPATTVTLRAVDTDGVSSSGHTEPAMPVRSGRLVIDNVFGSELVGLTMPIRVQYYQDAANGWVTNTLDTATCTSLVGRLTASNTIGSTSINGTLTIKSPSNNSTITLTNPSAGLWSLGFTAPGGNGYADVTPNLTSFPWLRYNWDNVDQGSDSNLDDDDPRGRATFGIYRGSPRHIYLRERY
jgi:MSHA biogenesis protein MshQ